MYIKKKKKKGGNPDARTEERYVQVHRPRKADIKENAREIRTKRKAWEYMCVCMYICIYTYIYIYIICMCIHIYIHTL